MASDNGNLVWVKVLRDKILDNSVEPRSKTYIIHAIQINFFFM